MFRAVHATAGSDVHVDTPLIVRADGALRRLDCVLGLNRNADPSRTKPVPQKRMARADMPGRVMVVPCQREIRDEPAMRYDTVFLLMDTAYNLCYTPSPHYARL